VFDAAADDEAVTASNIESCSLAGNFQMTAHNVNGLIVGMAVQASGPSLNHFVLGEK
jgi:hypothetical protein